MEEREFSLEGLVVMTLCVTGSASTLHLHTIRFLIWSVLVAIDLVLALR